MNLEKVELKMVLAQTWARKIEDIETSATRELDKLAGAIVALRQAADALDAHRAYYQDAVDKDEMSGDECALAMKVITKCIGGLQNLRDKAQLGHTLKQGELHGVKRGISMLEKEFQAEKAKLGAIASMVEDDRRPDAAARDIQHRRAEARAQGGRGGAPGQPEVRAMGAKKKATKATKKSRTTKATKATKKKTKAKATKKRKKTASSRRQAA